MTPSPLARRVAAGGVLPPGARVLAACSGGADSVALVLLLDELRRGGSLDLAVGHVHHGLRGAEADDDLAEVTRLAGALGVRCLVRRADAAAAAAHRRRGLEEGARHVRRLALEEMRLEAGCDLVALAHSADDQAETVMLRLLRGSGAEGLGGMPARSGTIVRPLLGVRRPELRAHAHELGARWASDPGNWSPASARSLVRELLGRLEEALDDRVVERLCETAHQLRGESALLDEAALAVVEPLWSEEAGPEGVPLVRVRDAASIAARPEALRRRVARLILRRLRPDEPPPSSDAVRRVLALLGPPPGPATALVPGLVLRRAGGDLLAGPERAAPLPAQPVTLLAPGATSGRARWAGGVLEAEPLEGAALAAWRPSPSAVLVDAASVADGLFVRGRRPGEAVEGTRGRRRVSELLAAGDVPAAWRDAHPLVCLGSGAATIVWLAGLEADPRFLAQAGCTSALELRWSPPRLPLAASDG